MLIDNLRKVRREFGNGGSFQIVPLRLLGGALFASISRRADRQVGEFSCVCERINIRRKGTLL
ncbi:hypothetical protein DPMN_065364 [Dreissena polymorpha]|uniref:Uncharacterized protein n=1 Tax=Dreissena polymorpha TaxID=45954 RepID=A0A9D4HN26_DREPO|nr:hypothetical protein DPMN_065364 [Dreissena polymorpha]